jgi:hypothetical protein
MFNRIHQKLGTAGFIISIVALVAALGGGAYAASGGLTGKQKKEVEKIAKKYAGKPGAAGATGPAGTAGAKGDAGVAGSNGTNGTGTNGKSVAVTPISAGTAGACEETGGALIKQEGASSGVEVCDGEAGQTGFTAALPSGKTETGAWSVLIQANAEEAEEETFLPISFNIPLEEPIAEAEVHKTGDTGFATSCPGTAATPEAEPGNLCLYVAQKAGPEIEAVVRPDMNIAGPGGAGRTGAILYLHGHGDIWGTYAVTAP